MLDDWSQNSWKYRRTNTWTTAPSTNKVSRSRRTLLYEPSIQEKAANNVSKVQGHCLPAADVTKPDCPIGGTSGPSIQVSHSFAHVGAHSEYKRTILCSFRLDLGLKRALLTTFLVNASRRQYFSSVCGRMTTAALVVTSSGAHLVAYPHKQP
jgi:hypothetical protein